MKISEKIQECSLSPMRKFHPYALKAVADGKKIYHLNIGQPDVKTPKAFFDAIRNFKEEVLAYSASPGYQPLIDAIVKYYQNIGTNFESDDVIITTGGSEALLIIMECILDEGSEVLMPEPFYPNYSTMVTLAGGKIRPIPTTPEEGYRFNDRAKIESLINENTRAIMVTNPGNPTGVVMTKEEMRMIADIAKEHDIYLISDEVYREYVYVDEPLESFGKYDDITENVVIIDSVSKRFSACGARVGAIISKNKTLMGEALKMAQARLSVATLDQVGAAALYDCNSSYFVATKEEYKSRRDALYGSLMKIPGVVAADPQGAFYLMAALPIDDSEKFQQWLLEEFEDNGETVMFAAGGPFYEGDKGKNEVRMAYVLKKEDLVRAMELLKIAIERYRKEVMGL